jgi:uncharacterized protein YyaL (SSP411 family)
MRILSAFLLFATFPLTAQDNEITWLGNYRDALRQAKQDNKPIFLEFRCEA